MGLRVSGEIINGETANLPGAHRSFTRAIAGWLLVAMLMAPSIILTIASILSPRPLPASILTQSAPLLFIAGLWVLITLLSRLPAFVSSLGGGVVIVTTCMVLAGIGLAAVFVLGRTGVATGLSVLVIAGVWIFLFLRLRFGKRASPLPPRFEATYEIGEDGFHVSNPLQEMTIRWPSISWVRPSGAYWVIRGAAAAEALPVRLFASVDDERAFIASVLQHLSPGARAASAAATAFVAWQ